MKTSRSPCLFLARNSCVPFYTLFYFFPAFGGSLPSTTKPRYLAVTASVQETFTVCSPGYSSGLIE
jgi:hypothetical protein